MDNNVQVIQVNSGDEVVEALKFISSMILSETYSTLEKGVLPKKEEFNTEEEYELAYKEASIQLIDEVQSIKKSVFSSVLDAYNNFLSEKAELDRMYKQQQEESNKIIDFTTYDMKKAGIITLGGSVLLPIIAPILLIINGPRIGIDFAIKKRHERLLEMNDFVHEEYKRIQDPFYEFVDTLRTDYHKSNKELKSIKEKALEGEQVEEYLLPILNPERVNLTKLPTELLLVNEHEENTPQLQYIKNNKN